jgi:hypothetical protein
MKNKFSVFFKAASLEQFSQWCKMSFGNFKGLLQSVNFSGKLSITATVAALALATFVDVKGVGFARFMEI